MNTIASPQKKGPGKGRTLEEEIQESIVPDDHEGNTTDGEEFLDDDIRMKDQPLVETSVKNEYVFTDSDTNKIS